MAGSLLAKRRGSKQPGLRPFQIVAPVPPGLSIARRLTCRLPLIVLQIGPLPADNGYSALA